MTDKENKKSAKEIARELNYRIALDNENEICYYSTDNLDYIRFMKKHHLIKFESPTGKIRNVHFSELRLANQQCLELNWK